MDSKTEMEINVCLCAAVYERFGSAIPCSVLNVSNWTCLLLQYTHSGKKVEIAVKKILNGEDVKVRGAYVNPDSLDLYYNIPELLDYWTPCAFLAHSMYAITCNTSSGNSFTVRKWRKTLPVLLW